VGGCSWSLRHRPGTPNSQYKLLKSRRRNRDCAVGIHAHLRSITFHKPTYQDLYSGPSKLIGSISRTSARVKTHE
jgi:hypothetical protein